MEEEFVLQGNIRFTESGVVNPLGQICSYEEFTEKIRDNDDVRDIFEDVSYAFKMTYNDYHRIFPDNKRNLERTFNIVSQCGKTRHFDFYKKHGFEIYVD